MATQEQLSHGFRRGINAMHTFGPGLPKRDLAQEARRAYASEEQCAAFFIGYCFADYLVKAISLPEEAKAGAEADYALARASFGRDVTNKVFAALEPTFEAFERAHNDGIAAAASLGPDLSEHLIGAAAIKRWSAPEQQEAYIWGYLHQAGRFGRSNVAHSTNMPGVG
jgi:hypothetical protein